MCVVVFLCVLAAASRTAAQARPIVWVLSTGGTIAGAGSSSTDLSNYKPGTILGEQLVRAVPQIAHNPQKARILLMLALSKTSDPREIRRIFAEY